MTKSKVRSQKKFQESHGEHWYSGSWRVIDKMCGRKRPKEGQVAGNSPEERVTFWLTHFRDTLGTRGPRRRYLLSWWISTLMTVLLQQGSSLRSKPPWDKGKSTGPDPCLTEDHWRGEEEQPNSSVVLHQLQEGKMMSNLQYPPRTSAPNNNRRHCAKGGQGL